MLAAQSSNTQPKAVIIVDPISTGANLAHHMLQQNKTVIAVWSDKVSETTMKLIMPGLRNDFYATLRFDYAHPQQSVNQLKSMQVCITSILAGSELGVELADELAELLELPGNGLALMDARREKYLMGETLREYAQKLAQATNTPPIRSVKQHRAEFFDNSETQAFIQDFFSPTATAGNHRMVVKPARSSGSDDVYLCSSAEEVKEKMNFILGRPNKLGIMNTTVLLQEYLEGDEYVVDTISRNGVHKLAGCWRYLKGAANGAQFVYHGMVIVDGKSDIGRRVFEYTKHVLDALDMRNGCGHAEVMLSPTKGPCLVEIGARLHGGEGIFMNVARNCTGYSQVEAAAAYLGTQQEFDSLPELWSLRPGCYGAAIDLISFREGKLAGYNKQAVQEAMQMPAFLCFNCMPKVGDSISKTVDCFTTVGSISIALTSPKVLDPDTEEARQASEEARAGIMRTIEQIRQLERRLFILEGDEVANDNSACIQSPDDVATDELKSDVRRQQQPSPSASSVLSSLSSPLSSQPASSLIQGPKLAVCNMGDRPALSLTGDRAAPIVQSE